MDKKQIILVTGAGSGIGRELAMQLARRGEVVYAGVRDLKRAQADYAAVDGAGLHIVRLDVTKNAEITRVVRSIYKDEGRLDVLVNNAGYGYYGAFEELSDRGFRDQLETNFYGALSVTRAVLPLMRDHGAGRIVNVSSILGRLAIPTGSAYTASKWAMEAWSEALRYEVGRFGIEVTLVEPGLVRTSFKRNIHISDRAEDRDSPYAFLNQLLRRDYEGFATPVERAAGRIVRILGKRRLGVRYRVGLDAHFYNVLRAALPELAWDLLFHWRVRGL